MFAKKIPEVDPLALAVMKHSVIPMWVKWAVDDIAFPIMVYINPMYTDWYGAKPEDYVGKTDIDVWGKDVGRAFRALDFAAMSEPEILMEDIEPTPGGKTEWCIASKVAVPHKNGFWIYGKAHAYTRRTRRFSSGSDGRIRRRVRSAQVVSESQGQQGRTRISA